MNFRFGTCEVEVTGDGPAVLLVHGVLVNGDLWNPIVGPLSTTHTVIKPHLPIGAHRIPVQHVEHLHPEGIADSLASLLDQLGIQRAVVVGNDTGGALSQLFTVRHPERVEALILTSCDTYDNFLPRNPLRVRPLKALVSIPGVIDLIAFTYRWRWVRRTWLGAGLLMTKPIDDAAIVPSTGATCMVTQRPAVSGGLRRMAGQHHPELRAAVDRGLEMLLHA